MRIKILSEGRTKENSPRYKTKHKSCLENARHWVFIIRYMTTRQHFAGRTQPKRSKNAFCSWIRSNNSFPEKAFNWMNCQRINLHNSSAYNSGLYIICNRTIIKYKSINKLIVIQAILRKNFKGREKTKQQTDWEEIDSPHGW